MATQQAKEPHMAFMTSSNDSFAQPVDGVFVKRRASDAERVTFAHETTSRSQSKLDEDLKSPTDTSSVLPIRQQVPSASKLPDEDNKYAPSDQEYWYHQHNQARLLIHTIHDLWRKDTEGLLQKIASLEEELGKHKDVPGGPGKENGSAAYGTPDIVKASQEKLRALSNVSYNPPVLDSAGITAASSERIQEGSRQVGFVPPQPSSTSPPHITFGSATLASIPENDFGLSVDDPPSPPTTAKIPTPPYLRTHAGHTPKVPIQELPLGDLNLTHIRPGQHGSLGEDLVSWEPRLLPSKPKNSSELETLDEKLKTVASDPNMSIPQALRHDLTSPTTTGPASGTARSPLPLEEPVSEQINGVRLKKKQSINFGAPLLHGVKLTPRSPDNEQL